MRLSHKKRNKTIVRILHQLLLIQSHLPVITKTTYLTQNLPFPNITLISISLYLHKVRSCNSVSFSKIKAMIQIKTNFTI